MSVWVGKENRLTRVETRLAGRLAINFFLPDGFRGARLEPTRRQRRALAAAKSRALRNIRIQGPASPVKRSRGR